MINKVILMGRLCADPDFRQTQSGTPVCRVRVAINRRFANKQTGEKQADFIPVVIWGQQAEFVNRYFHKGSMIIVEGSIRNNDYTDQNGVKHYSMEVHADNVSFGESKRASDSDGDGYQNAYDMPSDGGRYNSRNSSSQSYSTSSDTQYNSGISDFEEVLSDGEVPF